MRRGMLPYRRGAVRLRLGDYLVRTKLPAVPKVWGHITGAAPPVTGGWGTLGNLYAGCCVMAGAAHETQDWFWATRRPVPLFTNTSVLADYSRALMAAGGPPYDAGNPDTDTGLDPVATAQWRQTVGITDASGKVHRLGPFTAIETPEELDLAGYLGGAAAVCWALPASAEAQFEAGEVWDDTSQPPGPGHYTMLGGRNSAGHSEVVTWGRLQAATDAYVAKYMVGGMSYASQEYLLASGLTPEAINWAALAADQQGISNGG